MNSSSQIRQQTTDHEPVDYTMISGFVGVGMEYLFTSRSRNKVGGTQGRHTGEKPTQRMAQTSEKDDTAKFLEAELSEFIAMKGTKTCQGIRSH